MFILKEVIVLNYDYDTFNFDHWGYGHPLWITGVSGEGKSTLTDKLKERFHQDKNVQIATLDILMDRLACEAEDFNRERSLGKYNNSPIMLEFIDTFKNELPWCLKPIKNDMLRYQGEKEWYLKLFKWLVEKSKDCIIICEGIDIMLYMPTKWVSREPLIIMQPSLPKGTFFRIKRRLENNIGIFKAIQFEFEKKYLKEEYKLKRTFTRKVRYHFNRIK